MIHQGYSTKDRIGVELYIKNVSEKAIYLPKHCTRQNYHYPYTHFPGGTGIKILDYDNDSALRSLFDFFLLAFFLEGILFIGTGLLKTSARPKDTFLLSSTFSTIA